MGLEHSSSPDNTSSGLNISLPKEILEGIRDETHILLLDLFIETLHIDGPNEQVTEIFKGKLKEYTHTDPLLISESEGEVIRELIYQSAQIYINTLSQGSVYDPSNSYIIFNGIVINYSNIHQTQAREDNTYSSNTLTSSIRPFSRTSLPLELQKSMEDRQENQYESLERNGFDAEMRHFIRHQLYPRIMPEGEACNDEELQRIQDFLVFLIDIETTRGINLVNGVSTATGYTQTLNESDSDRTQGQFNSIDTRLRMAALFYSDGDLGTVNSFESINVEGYQEAHWVGELWDYNESGRNMIDFSFNSELKLTLIYFATKNPEALQQILSGENEADAARVLYEAHHTNVEGNIATALRVEGHILKYYG